MTKYCSSRYRHIAVVNLSLLLFYMSCVEFAISTSRADDAEVGPDYHYPLHQVVRRMEDTLTTLGDLFAVSQIHSDTSQLKIDMSTLTQFVQSSKSILHTLEHKCKSTDVYEGAQTQSAIPEHVRHSTSVFEELEEHFKLITELQATIKNVSLTALPTKTPISAQGVTVTQPQIMGVIALDADTLCRNGINRADYISVNSTEGLKSALNSSKPGDVIYAEEGEYRGNFVLRHSGVTLLGSGSGTVFRQLKYEDCVLIISGDNCTVCNIKVTAQSTYPAAFLITGGHNALSRVTIQGGAYGVLISKSGNNTMANLSVSRSIFGIKIGSGNGNRVTNCTLENIADIGLYVYSSHNEVEGVSVRNVRSGIVTTSESGHNRFSNIHYDRGDLDDVYEWRGAKILGERNQIWNMTCTRIRIKEKGGDIGVWVHDRYARNTEVINSNCYPIEDYGKGTAVSVWLESVVTEINFEDNVDHLIENAAKRPVDIVASFVISNNSSLPLVQKISQSRTFSEEFTVERMESLSQLHKVSVELTVGAKGKVGIPFVAEGEVSTELKTGYGYERTSVAQNRQKTTRHDKTFTIDKEVSVHPCAYTVVKSYINVVDNMPMPFVLTMKITGYKKNLKTKVISQINSREVVRWLPEEIFYEKDYDGETIIANSTGKLYASVGVDTFFGVDQRRLKNCGE